MHLVCSVPQKFTYKRIEKWKVKNDQYLTTLHFIRLTIKQDFLKNRIYRQVNS